MFQKAIVGKSEADLNIMISSVCLVVTCRAEIFVSVPVFISLTANFSQLCHLLRAGHMAGGLFICT